MDSSQIKKFIARPLATGATAYLLTYAFIGNDGYVPMLGMELSPASAIASVVIAGDIAGTVVKDKLMKTDQPNGFAKAESMLIKPLITSVGVVAVSSLLLGPPSTLSEFGKLAGLGAASSVGGKYAGDAIIPMLPL